MRSTMISRRGFLKVSSTSAGGILIGMPLFACSGVMSPIGASQFGFLLAVEPDGRVLFKAPTPNIGQGVWTGQAMIVAEELGVPLDKIEIEHLPLVRQRNESGELVSVISQGAGGSFSTKRTFIPIAKAAAEVRLRMMLVAASRWRIKLSDCRSENGSVINVHTNDRIGYGDLASEAVDVDLNGVDVPLKEVSEYRIIGTKQRTVGLDDVVTGKARYGIDFEIPGLKYAVIARAPNFGARIETYDDSEALASPGVVATVLIQGSEPSHYEDTVLSDGVAVVADSFWAALVARRKLNIVWRDGPFATESDDSFSDEAAQKMARHSPQRLSLVEASHEEVLSGLENGVIAREHGNVDLAFQNADRQFSRTYDLPFAAHATLEPQNCTARVYEGGCDIFVPTQSPNSAAIAVANFLGLDQELVNVQTLRSGGGFGRRLKVDYVLEAAMIAKEVDAPVKLIWTREDDIRYDYYRSRSRFEMNAAVNVDKELIGWHVREASAPLEVAPQRIAMGELWGDIGVSNYFLDNNYLAAEELHFQNFPAHESFIPNFRMDHFFVHSGVPRHAWRAPGVHSLEFANQSFLCELAHELGEDPVEFLLRLIGPSRAYETQFSWMPEHDNERLAAVLRLAAEKAKWGKYAEPGFGQGAAVAFLWGTYVAQVVDVHVSNSGELTVLKVTCAIDCGMVVNPTGATKQAEGAICDALSLALGQEINIKNGFPVQSNFHDYSMMRINQSPRAVDVHFIEGDYPPVGMGEPAVPPLAPALCNAIFSACGRRIRKLPVGDQLTL